MTNQIVALVRDKDGNPKFDNWNNIPAALWAMLSDSDIQYILTKRGNI